MVMESGSRGVDCDIDSSFSPTKLVKCLGVLSLCPRDSTDKLDFVIARAQLLAFYRWKGFSELPKFTIFGGIDGGFGENNELQEEKDSEGDTEDDSWSPQEIKKHSLRKQKPNSKYNEDNVVDDDDFDGAIEKGNKRISSRKRKPNSKYRESEGITQSWLMEEDVTEDVCQDENTRFSSRKQKTKFNYFKNGDDAQMEGNIVGAHMSNEVKGFKGDTEDASHIPEENKHVLSRKRKPKSNTKYNEDGGGFGLVSSQKRKMTTKYIDDECETRIRLHEDSEMKDLEEANENRGIVQEGNKRVSLRKRTTKTKYNENAEEDVDPLVSEEREDSEGSAKKRVSSRKRKPNTKYNDDGDYFYDAMREHENSQIIGQNESVKGPYEKSCEKSQNKRLAPIEYPPPDVMLSQLYSSAKDPTKGDRLPTYLITFFADYRNSLSLAPKGFTGIEYFKRSESDFETEAIERETRGASYKDEKNEGDYIPTAVILFFVDTDSVPSKSDLHYVFSSYGDLDKSKTEVVKRLRRARVVFKRRLDAENASKSTGKFSIFGPSLGQIQAKAKEGTRY